MATQWGRKHTIIWPPHIPIMSYCAIAAAFLLTFIFAWQRYAFQLAPLQWEYFVQYARAGVGSTMHAHQNYRLLYLGGAKARPRIAFPVDFAPGKMKLPDGKIVRFTLSELAQIRGWLHDAIYEGKSPSGTFAISFIEGGACLILLLALAIPRDIQRFKEMKYGRILRGPRMPDPNEFNKAQKGDGIGFKTTESDRMMRIPLRKEAQHLQLMGDTGLGRRNSSCSAFARFVDG